MAEVYDAWDTTLRRRVAVKVLWDGLARDPVSRERFRREAQAAASLLHPNIVSVFDLGSVGDVPYFVMELVEGRGLDDLVWREAPLPVERALAIADAVASALGRAHAAGIVHRDVKPANVVVGPDGTVRVLDFGIARSSAWTPLTQNQAVQGTPHYVAPEVVRGERADARSDLYSLGAVVYEMLCGRPPFTGESSMAIAYRHVEEEPVPVGQWNRDVSRAVEAVVMRCLAKDPDRRYQRVEDLRRDLRAAAGAAPEAGVSPRTVALPPSPSTVPLPSAGRTPVVPPPPRRDTPALNAAAANPDRGRPGRGVRVAAAVVCAAVLAGSVALLWSLNRVPADVGANRPIAAPEAPPLLAPTGVRSAGACDGFLSAVVAVTWKATESRQADGYEVFRSTAAAGPFRSVATVIGRTTVRYEDADVGSGATYYYLVRTSGDGRSSLYSTPSQAKTPSLCLFP